LDLSNVSSFIKIIFLRFRARKSITLPLLASLSLPYMHKLSNMDHFVISVGGLLVLPAYVMATGASYPPKPVDLSTPVQQRLAVIGPNGECADRIDLSSVDY
jgi:hypothetical protein